MKYTKEMRCSVTSRFSKRLFNCTENNHFRIHLKYNLISKPRCKSNEN